MHGHYILPVGLLTLLFSSLALAQQPTPVPVSPNDPFRDIAKLAQPQPEPPVCCLKPLASNEPTEELLVSFEEWKERQERTLRERQGNEGKDGAATTKKPATPSNTLAEPPEGEIEHEDIHNQDKQPLAAPAHFRVPITDRFNFASSDCSARVHYAHNSARSVSSLLSSKKDRYMLSPCNTPENKYIVVELCDFIRIDTVQLANFEFFSGVFKDFTIHVAPAYDENLENWTFAGIYRARNIRGIQTFQPDTSALRDFYRFIRIDFHSHYGNEFYCPISLLRVYGLTDLEQWKWEMWEKEYNERQAALGRRAIDAGQLPSAENVVQIIREMPEPRGAPAAMKESLGGVTTTSVDSADTAPVPTPTSETLPSAEAFTTTNELDETPASKDIPVATTASFETLVHEPKVEETSITTVSSVETAETLSSTPMVSEVPVSERTAESQSESSLTSTSAPEASLSGSSVTSSPLPSTSTSVQIVGTQEQRPASGAATTGSGESIYRTIMTRLSALEFNSTLYVRYVEEQTKSMRDALIRLEEDLGRLEGITKAQAQFFQKTITEWERQRKRLEREHDNLLARVDNLADEVVLEKRLGIAQLCLLLTVLVFMVLTRGSRGEPIISPISIRRHDSLKEWGKRHLSSFGSGEWGTLGKEPGQTLIPSRDLSGKKEKIKLSLDRTPEHRFNISHSTSIKTGSGATPSRRRTPSEIRAPHPRHFVSHRPKTPTSTTFHPYPPRSPAHGHSHSAGVAPQSTGPRPRLRRTNSQNATGTLPHSLSFGTGLPTAPSPSAKKWAKTAHLHEIRKPRNENASPSPTKPMPPALQTGSGEKGLEEALRSLSPRLEPARHPGSESTMFWLESPHQLDKHKPHEARGRSKEWEKGLADKPKSKSKSKLDLRQSLTSSPELEKDRKRSDMMLIQGNTEGFRLGSPYRERTSLAGVSDGRPRALDVDTESESWVDTDIESSDMGDRSPTEAPPP